MLCNEAKVVYLLERFKQYWRDDGWKKEIVFLCRDVTKGC